MSSVHAERLGSAMDWQEIDRELRSIAKLRGSIDEREAALLCSAARHEIWRHLGRASFFEYLEEVLGYTPKCARERVRVAVALDTMPELAEALATGEQSYSAIRELTRVATPATQTAWREAARGKNVRQIEELVAVHAPGDPPDGRPRPDLEPRVVRFEISPATFARLRQVQQMLAEEHAGQLDDNALVEALCDAVLDGDRGDGDDRDDRDQGRARFQIMTTVCAACSQGWQLGGGREIAVTATDVAIAECDAQRIGSDREPARATQDVAPMVRRHVERRDHGACQVPGCRASRHIDVHHIVPRHLGGGHEADSLTLLCAGHHRSLHEGALTITGRAPALVVTWNTGVGHEPETTPHVGHAQSRHVTPRAAAQTPRVRLDPISSAALPEATPHVGHPSRYGRVVMKTDAIQALTQLGFSKPTARGLVDAVLETASLELTLEQLLRDALQRSRAL